jgi:hypothetical protein
MKLIWEKTGDSIEIIPANISLAELYINSCQNQNQNLFQIKNKFSIENKLIELTEKLSVIIPLLTRIKINDFNFFNVAFDQCNLNLLHQRWVELHIKYPNIKILLGKMNLDAPAAFDRINKLIHEIEQAFRVNLYSEPFLPIPNTLGTDILNFDKANIQIEFNNLGRTTHNKWLNFDNSVNLNDRNDYLEFYGEIKLNLDRTFSTMPELDYLIWCQQRNIKATGAYLNLGNFANLEQNLTQYRSLFVKNFNDIDNKVKFEL